MEYHKPIKVLRKGEVNGSQYGQSGKTKPDRDSKVKPDNDADQVDGAQNLQDIKKYPCFRCEQFRPDCRGAKNCSHTSKKDGTPVNSPEVVEKKFEELKKAKQQNGGK